MAIPNSPRETGGAGEDLLFLTSKQYHTCTSYDVHLQHFAAINLAGTTGWQRASSILGICFTTQGFRKGSDSLVVSSLQPGKTALI